MDINDKKYDQTNILIRLLTYVKPVSHYFILIVIGYVLYSAANAYYAEILRHIINYVNSYSSGETNDALNSVPSSLSEFSSSLIAIDNKLFIVISIVFTSIVRGIGNFMGLYFICYISNTIVQSIRRDLHEHYMVMASKEYDKSNLSHLISRINFNSQQLSEASSNGLIIIIRETIMLTVFLSYMLYQNWRLTLLFLVIMPIVAYIMKKAARKFHHLSREIQNAMANVTLFASETIQGHQLVKIHGAQKFERSRFAKALNNLIKQNLKNAKTEGLSVSIIQILLSMVMAVITYIALSNYFLDSFSTGQFVAFFAIAGLMAQPMKALSQINKSMQKGITAAQDIFMQLDSEKEQDLGTEEIVECKGKIKISNISFSYYDDSQIKKTTQPIIDIPSHERKIMYQNNSSNSYNNTHRSEQQAIKNIYFEILPGQCIAIVGKSGSGKSTLINLLMRFYDYTSGTIYIDDIPINKLKINNLRSHISLVSQKNLLFNGTVLDNVCYGTDADKIDIDRVMHTLEQVYSLDFVNKLPDGINTFLGDNGTILSGGQAQRIALARALYKDSKILILDEATSALDNEAEMHIKNSINNMMHSKTMIIIAHRLSTVRNSDKIIVINQGELIEEGSHDELIKLGGLYKNLYTKQEI